MQQAVIAYNTIRFVFGVWKFDSFGLFYLFHGISIPYGHVRSWYAIFVFDKQNKRVKKGPKYKPNCIVCNNSLIPSK